MPVSVKPPLKSKNDFSAIPQNGTVLFQGDSITDGGRDGKINTANDGLGHGYVFLAAVQLRDQLAARNIQVYNRGISGNKVFQLSGRWQNDCRQLKPDLLSILIGVNDFWHTLDLDYQGTVEIYRDDLSTLLKRTNEKLPDVKFIMGELFAVREGSAITQEWFPIFEEYQLAARELAQEFEAAFIPYQSVFEEAFNRSTPTYWTEDGVHPTLAGSQLMAQAWIETAKRM